MQRILVILGPAVLLAGASPGPVEGQVVGPRPALVTDSAVARGREVFLTGVCATCHGADGKGSARGPDLTDSTWTTGAGSYEEIVRQVIHGERPATRTNMVPMPMRGWEPISHQDIQAVAAYVWTLSRDRP